MFTRWLHTLSRAVQLWIIYRKPNEFSKADDTAVQADDEIERGKDEEETVGDFDLCVSKNDTFWMKTYAVITDLICFETLNTGFY